MSRERRRRQAGAQNHAPVVITFDREGGVFDIVGDVDRFVSSSDTRETVLGRLRDMLESQSRPIATFPAIELSEDRFADVQIVIDNDSRNVVLRDVSPLMREVRRRQQASNELSLGIHEEQRKLSANAISDAWLNAKKAGGLRYEYRPPSDLFASLTHRCRIPVMQISAHAQRLAHDHGHNEDVMSAVAAISRAVNRLDSLVYEGLILLGGGADANPSGALDLHAMANTLHDAIALQASARNIRFSLQLPTEGVPHHFQGDVLQRLIMIILVRCLDDDRCKEISVSFSLLRQGLGIEVACEPKGLVLDQFGALVTVADQSQFSPEDFDLALISRLLRRLEGNMEVVSLATGGNELWIEAPFSIEGESTGEEVL